MTTTEPTNETAPPKVNGHPVEPLKLLRLPDQRPPIDTTVPVLPAHLRDREAFTSTARVVARRNVYRGKKWAFHGPWAVLLLVGFAPRGLARIVGHLGRYLYDYDSAKVRAQHAANVETPEYARVHNIRRANIKARWMVAGTGGVLVIGPVMAWTFPHVLSWIIGAALFVWIVKLIPGRGLGEIAVGAAVGAACGFLLPFALAKLPQPPAWALWTTLAVVVLTLGWIGRPKTKPLVSDTQGVPLGVVEKPTADGVLEALCRLGITALTPAKLDDVKLNTRVIQPGVARSRRGYHVQMELPWAVTAGEVMERREGLAAALKRELGTVWPSQGPRHPGHLNLFLSDQPMATAPQPKWPLLDAKSVDIFDRLPLFTDQEGGWVDLQLAYKRVLIGGASGTGKSFYTRQIGLAAALDPRVRIIVMDGKVNGDLDPLMPIAHGFYAGAEDEEIEEQLHALKALEKEMMRRNRFLRGLDREINPESKVTSEIVDMFPDLAPYVLLIDEVQEYTEHEDKATRAEFVRIFTRFARLGRSSGIIPVFATQKPDAKVLPTSITSNCTTRFCLRVIDYAHTDQVLGSGSSKAGLKAQLFAPTDVGMAWHRGDGQEPLVVRSVFGIDGPTSDAIVAKALAARKARGLLTGAAAGEEEEADATQRHLLEDVLAVFAVQANAPKLHLADLADGLADAFPGLYSHVDPTALGSMLRAAGVTVKNVWVTDKGSHKGVQLDQVQRAAADAVLGHDGDEEDADGPDSA